MFVVWIEPQQGPAAHNDFFALPKRQLSNIDFEGSNLDGFEPYPGLVLTTRSTELPKATETLFFGSMGGGALGASALQALRVKVSSAMGFSASHRPSFPRIGFSSGLHAWCGCWASPATLLLAGSSMLLAWQARTPLIFRRRQALRPHRLDLKPVLPIGDR